MGGEIQNDECKRKEWAREFDAIIETCETKTRQALCAAIKEKNPFMLNMDRRDRFYESRNEVAFNRINLAIKKAQKSSFPVWQGSLQLR